MGESSQSLTSTCLWEKDKVLGTGGFGTVTLWHHKDTGETIAIKKCRWGTNTAGAENVLSPKHIERWKNEVEIMMKLDHSCVVRCFPVPVELEGSKDDLPMLCMEYCSGGDLRKVLNRPENCCGLKEVDIRNCLRDLSQSVSYLHTMRIIHRDLKPENIVLQSVDGQIRYKLIDLGYAKELEHGSVCTSFVGTLQYLAPELFLSKRYSCTVDYWSLGLVTHEIITGLRPFLPNMTPVEWMKKVHAKKHEHISVYEGRNGAVLFSETMFNEVNISKHLKAHIESWLRVMLEWDPSLRGQEKAEGDDKNKVVAFSMVNNILAKKIVKIFVIETYQLLDYEVNESTTMAELQQWVEKDSGIPVNSQRPLLPRGQPPDITRPATQCWAPPDEDEWLLYVFSGKTKPQIAPHFPPLVEEMLRQSRSAFDFPTQRRMWAHSIFFLQRESRLMSLLCQAQKVSMLHLMTLHTQLSKTGQRMLSDVSKLQSRHNLFMESLTSDLDTYDEMAQAGLITSQKLFRGWKEMGEVTLHQIHLAVERVHQFEGSLTALNTKVIELQCSPFVKGGKVPDGMEAILKASEDLHLNLRRKTKEQRAQKAENTDMCKLMVQALKKRDKLHHELYKHIEKQNECLSDIELLSEPLEKVLQDIARTAQNISVLQKQRQKDIWKIVDIAITHSTQVSEDKAQPIPNPPLGKQPSPEVLSSLNAFVDKSNRETDAVINENRLLRSQMMDLLSSNINTTLSVGSPKDRAAVVPLGKMTHSDASSGAIPKVPQPAPRTNNPNKLKGTETSL